MMTETQQFILEILEFIPIDESVLIVQSPHEEVLSVLRVMVDNKKNDFELTIVTSLAHWDVAKFHYELDDSIRVVHASGKELDKYYAQADLTLMKPFHEYFRVTFPIKMFESISKGVPFISEATGVCGDFINKEDVGITFSDVESGVQALKDLVQQRDRLIELKKNVVKIQEQHTWEARARAVIESLYRKQEVVEF